MDNQCGERKCLSFATKTGFGTVKRLLVLLILFASRSIAFAGSGGVSTWATDSHADFHGSRGDEINLFGFRPGMHERDALDHARNVGLQDEDWMYFVVPGTREVHCFYFSILGLQTVARANGALANTFEELAQSVANEVGRLEVVTKKNYTERQFYPGEIRGDFSQRKWYERKLLDGSELWFENRSDSFSCKLVGPKTLCGRVRGAALKELLSGFGRIGDEPVLSAEITFVQYECIEGSPPTEPPGGYAEWRRKFGKRGGAPPAHVSGWRSIKDFCDALNKTEEAKAAGLYFSPPDKEEWEKKSHGKPAPFQILAETVKGHENRVARETEAFERAVRDSFVEEMVSIPGRRFRMGKFEVTKIQWEIVMGKGTANIDNDPAVPVTGVSRTECLAFLKKLNELPNVRKAGLVFRLPTKEEWTFACLAGSKERFNWTKSDDDDDFDRADAWHDHRLHAVGKKEPNAFGLHDMLGNAQEWLRDTERGQAVAIGGSSWDSPRKLTPERIELGNGSGDRTTGFRLCAETQSEIDSRETNERSNREQAISSLVSDMVPVPAKNFLIGKFEVTQKQWDAVMGADSNPSRFKGPDLPVENVSRVEVQRFLEKLNATPEAQESGLVFQLPSRVEWTKACLAGSPGPGCRLSDKTKVTTKTFGQAAWYKDNSGGKTHPVGLKMDNAYGIYDMHGNVSEWTRTDDPSVHSPVHGIVMGERYSSGGCGNVYAWGDANGRTEVASSSMDQKERADGVGFRLCATKRKP